MGKIKCFWRDGLLIDVEGSEGLCSLSQKKISDDAGLKELGPQLPTSTKPCVAS